MKLKKLTCGAAILGLAAGATVLSGAGSASAVVHIDIRPYVGGTIAIGSTNPGFANSKLCLVLDAGTGNHGKINGVVVAPATQLDISIVDQTFVPAGNACTPTPVTVDTVDADTTTVGSLTGGTASIGVVSSTQSGISATAVTTVRVNYSVGQSVALPAGATIVAGALSGGSSVDLDLKPSATLTKSALSAACSDTPVVIDTATHDTNVKSLAPIATKITGATTLAAGQYTATIRECAQSTAAVVGKEGKTKIKITGHGAVSVQFLKAATVNPQTWDTTYGKCSVVKTVGDIGSPSDPIDASRVIQCKGGFGAPIPLSLVVRGWTTAGGTDPFGLNNPGPPVTLTSGTI